ncbi:MULTISPECIES: glycosyltransferase family 4 protein [unclassified Sporosarcina]|uniref:glycosyltransferase family 4 protein n=1 Tax=unclassified Sporosarcina TaxID=2647733 RepID=UPI000C165723|nr:MULTISPECIES: glycosyltransferase family 4 protein [unclassified Sporosarcina]PID05900.1 glycosyltransferase WbuB [Sporosarcina sp. P30]PID09094.1 glycosyltransferase WbuB [Sporosarcina sp. P31]PID12391.1 glycosyltransferase WbuB [Sporosarcina sp. P32b]
MKEKKDVLFLCQYFYPEYVSSATLPLDTAVSLIDAGFTVGALTGYPKEYNITDRVPMKEVYKGIGIKRLKYIQLKRSHFIGRLINYFSFTLSVALRFKELRKYKAIIVYSNPPVLPLIAVLANKLFKTKVIFVSYDVYPEMAYITNTISKDGIISKMMKTINKIIFKRVNKVVALSYEMKTYLLDHRSALSGNQIEVIPNWYEDKGVSNLTESTKNKLFSSILKDEKFVVSYFGNMGICQDLDTIVAAIRQFKNDSKVQFIFAGHGNKMEVLKEIIEKESLYNVRIFDFLHGQDFQDALNISDCFIVSLADGLTGLAVPSKTYGYMMASKPVIAIIGADSDIAKDLTNNNAGYSMQVGESLKLVSAILELKDDKGKREAMGRNCRNVFLEKYTKEHCTKQYVDMMRKILEG